MMELLSCDVVSLCRECLCVCVSEITLVSRVLWGARQNVCRGLPLCTSWFQRWHFAEKL